MQEESGFEDVGCPGLKPGALDRLPKPAQIGVSGS